MLKRTSIDFVNKTLQNNPNWKILDVGCGYRPNINATVIADVQDFSSHYKDKKFVQINDKKLPFNDKEFDFVISSHVIEHVSDFEFFIKELERISSKGYIELPSRIGDNLVFENVNDHIWWFVYDDINNLLKVSKKNQNLEPFLTVSSAKILEKIFRESLVMELFWENKIDYIIDEKIKNDDFTKISFLTILRKYISKKIRTILRKK